MTDGRTNCERRDAVLIAAFLAALAAPGAAMAVRGSPPAPLMAEKPHPWTPPQADAWSLLHFPLEVRAYFNVNFGLRPGLIRAVSRFKLRLFHVPANRMVIVGEDGWLYLAADQEDDCCRQVRPFTQAELAGWRSMLEKRRDWLAERGIPYVFVIAPDKHTVQGEHVPAWMRPTGDASRLDQLVDYLRRTSTVSIVDVRSALLHAKQDGDVYFKLDSHWNEQGAFVAYRETMAALAKSFPALHPATMSEFDVSTSRDRSGDLAAMLAISDDLEQPEVHLTPKTPRAAVYVEGAEGPVVNDHRRYRQRASQRPDAEVPRAVIFHDSFGATLNPFLAEHFGRAVYEWTWGFDTSLVEREKPSVVINQLVERALMRDLEEMGEDDR